MRKGKSKGIAIAGVLAALQITFVLLGFYLQFITLTFNFLAAIALMVTAAVAGKRTAALSYVAVALLAFAFTGYGCIPYVVFFGFFTLVSLVMRDCKCKWYIIVPTIIVISTAVFYLCYIVFSFIAIDFTRLGITIPYYILTAFFTIACFAYYYALFAAFRVVRERLGKYFM